MDQTVQGLGEDPSINQSSWKKPACSFLRFWDLFDFWVYIYIFIGSSTAWISLVELARIVARIYLPASDRSNLLFGRSSQSLLSTGGRILTRTDCLPHVGLRGRVISCFGMKVTPCHSRPCITCIFRDTMKLRSSRNPLESISTLERLRASLSPVLSPISMPPLLCAPLCSQTRFPLRYVGLSSCFRREAGSSGRDARRISAGFGGLVS